MKKFVFLILILQIIVGLNFNILAQNFEWEKVEGNFTQDVKSIAIDSNNNIWIGTPNGLFFSPDNCLTWQQSQIGLPDSMIVSTVLVNSRGDKYIRSYSKGIFFQERDSNIWIDLTKDMKDFLFGEMILDSKDILYVNFHRYNSNPKEVFWYWFNINDSSWNYIFNDSRLAVNFLGKNNIDEIFRLYNAMDNRITRSFSINKEFDNLQFFSVSPICMQVNKLNHIFLGTSEGIFKSTNNGNTFQYCPLGMGNIAVRCLRIFENGNITVGTDRGIFFSDNGGEYWEQNNFGLNGEFQIRAIEIDKEQNILIGNAYGLFRSKNIINTPVKRIQWIDKGRFLENQVMQFGINDIKIDSYNDRIYISGDREIKIISYRNGNLIRNIFDRAYTYVDVKGREMIVSNFFLDGIVQIDSINQDIYIGKLSNLFFYQYDLNIDSIIGYFPIKYINVFEQCSPTFDNYNFQIFNDKIFLGISGKCYWKYLDASGQIDIFDIKSKKIIKEIDLGYMDNYLMSPNGVYIVSTSSINQLFIWDSLLNNTFIDRNFENCKRLKFSHDSKFLSTLTKQDKINIWNFPELSLYRTFNLSNNSSVSDIEFSLNDRYLISASDDSCIRVWNINSGSFVDSIQFESGANWILALSNDSVSIAAGSSNGLVRLFKFDILTSVSELPSTQNCNIRIFPNPFSENCQIELPFNTERVEIFNALGEKVDTIVYPFIWKPESKLGNGVYFFRVFVGNEILTTQGFLIR
ncbi:MAG: T9SS type A sorting domain-containing protein [bacterium]